MDVLVIGNFLSNGQVLLRIVSLNLLLGLSDFLRSDFAILVARLFLLSLPMCGIAAIFAYHGRALRMLIAMN